MESVQPEKYSSFRHVPIKTERSTLIQSTCKICGKSRIVSHHDGSLEQWENEHECHSVEAQAS